MVKNISIYQDLIAFNKACTLKNKARHSKITINFYFIIMARIDIALNNNKIKNYNETYIL